MHFKQTDLELLTNYIHYVFAFAMDGTRAMRGLSFALCTALCNDDDICCMLGGRSM